MHTDPDRDDPRRSSLLHSILDYTVRYGFLAQLFLLSSCQWMHSLVWVRLEIWKLLFVDSDVLIVDVERRMYCLPVKDYNCIRLRSES